MYSFSFKSGGSGNIHPYASSAVSAVAKPQLMLLMWAPLKYEFNMKVGRASLHSIVMAQKQWGADTGDVIGKMSGQIDRFSVKCYVIRSVINPSETTACSAPGRRRGGEVYAECRYSTHYADVILSLLRDLLHLYWRCGCARRENFCCTVSAASLLRARCQLGSSSKPKPAAK